jgi:hypothetical protein
MGHEGRLRCRGEGGRGAAAATHAPARRPRLPLTRQVVVRPKQTAVGVVELPPKNYYR